MTTTEEPQQQSAAPPKTPTYGNWHRRPRGGLWGLGMVGTVIAGAAVIFTAFVLLTTNNMVTTGVVALILALVIGVLLVPDKHNRSTVVRLNSRIKWHQAKASGSNLYRSGPLTPMQINKLPGIIGKTTTTEWVDGSGKVFVLLSYRSGYHTLVWEAFPDGSTNVDPDDINRSVAKYGAWLGEHGDIPGLLGASVTIETAPDTGGRLRRENVSLIKEDAPPLAKAVMGEIVSTYPAGSADVRAWITMSFSEKGRVTKARSEAERIEKMAASLSLEIPEWTLSLTGTGAGVVRPMDVQGLCEVIRVAYDPAAAEAVEEAHAAGVSVQALSWDTVGPVACDPGWDHMIHDSGVSVTSVMTAAPRQNVHSDILRKVLEPSRNVLRKRVTIHYQIVSSEKASQQVEADLSNAIFAHHADRKKTASKVRAMKIAQQTAQEEAAGAGLEDFAIAWTTTVASVQQLPEVLNLSKTLGIKAKLLARICYGFQDSSFAFTLPVGFQPKRHIKLPKAVKRVTGL